MKDLIHFLKKLHALQKIIINDDITIQKNFLVTQYLLKILKIS